jgi:hypothetical protein
VLTEIDKAQRLIARRTLDMEDPDLPSEKVNLFASVIITAQKRLASLIDEKSRLESQISAEESKVDALYCSNELLALVRSAEPKNNDRRLRLREQIRRRISRIDFYFDPGLAQKCAPWARLIARITFVNGSDRFIILGEETSGFLKLKHAVPDVTRRLERLK